MKAPLRALIVEDSEDDARLLLRDLERSDYEIAHRRVETAEALRAALDRESWDILFCDFTMPQFSGQTALEIVKERDLDLPFIFVSGTLGEDIAVQAMKAGAHDYVLKNNLARLIPAMERELREANLRRQHRQAEEQRAQECTPLAARERALSNLVLANLPAVFYVFEEGGKFLRWNTNLELVSGYSAEEFERLTPLDLFPVEAKWSVQKAIERVLTNGAATIEADLVAKDGRRLPFFFRTKRILVDEKPCVLGVGVDITEGKQAQLLNLAKEAIFVCDRDGSITYWNLGAKRRYGWTQEEALGKHAHTFLQTIFPRPLEEIWAILLKDGYWEGELKHATRDGRRIMVASRWSLQRDEHSNLAGFLEINSDITERKRAEKTLRESESQVRIPTDSLTQLIWTCQADGRCDYLSPQWIGYTGIPGGQKLAYGWAEPLHPEDRSRVQTAWIEVLETGKDFDIDFRIRRADGVYRWFKTRAVAIRNGADKIIKWFGINTDVENLMQSDQYTRTLNTALERRVEERTAQLEATNKELEAFAYSVSHDMRAPLRSIDGFSRILLEDYANKLDEEGRYNLQRVRAASQRMGLLIDDLLQLSRITRSEFYLGPVDLSALARAVVTELHTREPGRRVEFISRPDVVAPQADARLLRIVIENLLANAWKFTSKQPAAKIEFGEAERDGAPVYYVRDNGVGFDMAYAHKLFGAFQRLHRAEEYEGTGIGLTIVQRIVHRHGGRVWAEGELGKGATFYFTLLD